MKTMKKLETFSWPKQRLTWRNASRSVNLHRHDVSTVPLTVLLEAWSVHCPILNGCVICIYIYNILYIYTWYMYNVHMFFSRKHGKNIPVPVDVRGYFSPLLSRTPMRWSFPRPPSPCSNKPLRVKAWWSAGRTSPRRHLEEKFGSPGLRKKYAFKMEHMEPLNHLDITQFQWLGLNFSKWDPFSEGQAIILRQIKGMKPANPFEFA